MKILKLILENFTNFYTAQNAKKITIDFTTSTTPICLLIGPNGSGKTTLLGVMHPFANIGNLDVRNGHDMIIEGENGYKEIHIKHENDIYVIKHFYSPNSRGTHSVKSYISKNGDELNPNGNVSSFIEFVKEELDVEPDFLKLIRLGNNVTNLINLSETERKNFMSKLLDDVGIYLQFHKKVNTDLRELKEIMSHDEDKLKRLGIKSSQEASDDLNKLELQLEEEVDLERSIRDKISVLNHEISKVSDPLQLKYDIKEKNRKLKKMGDVLEKNGTDSKTCDKEIRELETKKAKIEATIESSRILIDEYISTLDQTYDKYHGKKIKLNQELESDKEVLRMNDLKHDLENKIRRSEELLKDMKISCSKVDFEKLLVFIKTANDTITRCYSFGLEPVREVTRLMRKKENIELFIESNSSGLLEKDNDGLTILKNITRGVTLTTDKLCDTQNTCPAYRVYSQAVKILKSSQPEKKVHDKEFYTYMDLVYKILISTLPSFSEYKEIIQTLPQSLQDFFTEKNVYENIDAGKDIYDQKMFHDFLAIVTEHDSLEKMREELKQLDRDIKTFNKSSNTTYLEDELNDLQESIDSYNSKLKDEKMKLGKNEDELSDISRTLEVLYETKDALTNFEAESELLKEMEDDYNSYLTNKEKILEYDKKLTNVVAMISELRMAIQGLTNAIDQYLSLKDELDRFHDIYDEITLVKESLSSKKGIPLYYIDMYLGNTEDITNELLDIVYNGRLYIDNFKLTATEFAIPYFNRGKRIDDIKYASSGEEAFLSLALSFALASQAISKYNIMLLDEVDATLDQSNREKFIRILEKQIDMISSEQNFLITHNNMFSSYNLDIIDFSLESDSYNLRKQYPLANFIEIERE